MCYQPKIKAEAYLGVYHLQPPIKKQSHNEIFLLKSHILMVIESVGTDVKSRMKSTFPNVNYRKQTGNFF